MHVPSALLPAVLLVGSTLTLAAQAQQTTLPSAAEQAHEAPLGAQAIRVVRDKSTGRLRAANAEELAEIQAAERNSRLARGKSAQRAETPVRVQRHANGMVSAVLSPDHLVTLQARRLPDGRLVMQHDQAVHDHPLSQGGAVDNRPTE